MKYKDFENIVSSVRMKRYLTACGNDTRKAMTLYRYNIKLSQELLAVVCCFEVALRNRINALMIQKYGNDWLRDLVLENGSFHNVKRIEKTAKIIYKNYFELPNNNQYTHHRLLSEMEFGVWKYMFNNKQYSLTGQCLLKVFPKKPISSSKEQYDNSYIFRELNFINNMRNRIAHHEPICFGNRDHHEDIDTSYAMNRYNRILTLFEWMDIDGKALLYGLDDVECVCSKINK